MRGVENRVRGWAVLLACASLVLYPTAQNAQSLFEEPAQETSRTAATSRLDIPSAHQFADGQLLALQNPTQGIELTGDAVEFAVAVSNLADASTLQAELNGNAIGSVFQLGACNGLSCIASARISASDGLINGKNGLTVTVQGVLGNGDAARVRFDWYADASVRTRRSLPPTVSFRTINPGGGARWISIGSTILPIGGNNCTALTMQVVVIDRYELTQKEHRCFVDATSLKAYLRQRTRSDLVIAGTTGRLRTLFSGLDTSAIGGTNYEHFPANQYPRSYMIVGVGGATPGQAYESYSSERLDIHDATFWPKADGMLSEDTKYTYNFHSSARVPFRVVPDARNSRSPSSIHIGERTFTAGDWKDGFWVLKLDRVALQPLEVYSRGSGCRSDLQLNEGTCGRFFPTGSSDAVAASRAISELANYLNEGDNRTIIFLTSSGTPLTTRARPNDALFQAVNRLGGSGYALMKLGSSSTYSIVSTHDRNYDSSLQGKAAFSSSVLSEQGQNGKLRGLLTQNHLALFSPMVFAQESDDKTNVADFSFEQVTMAIPGAWPYSDSPGHVAAYRYLSHELLKSYLQDPSGDHLDDIRYYYTGSQNVTIANGVKEPTSFPYLDHGCACSRQEWDETAEQLRKEKGYLRQLINFFGNASEGKGMGGVIAGSGTSVTLSLLSAANEVRSGLLQPNPDAVFRLGASDVLRLTLGLVQIGNNFTPGSLFGPAISLVSGIVELSATLTGGLKPAELPSPEYTFTTTLRELTSNTNVFLNNMRTSFNTSMDAIYSDWYKLQTAGMKVVDTREGGWYYDTQARYGIGIQNLINKGMQRNAYFQLTRLFNGLDYWHNPLASSFDRIGSVYVKGTAFGCKAFYADNKTPAAAAFSFPTPGGMDIFVVAGEITNNYKNSVTENNIPLGLLNTLLENGETDLNTPKETFFGPSGPLARRDGPQYSKSLCNNP